MKEIGDAVSTGAVVRITTKAGEFFIGECEEIIGDFEDADAYDGPEVSITICGQTLLYQEIASWGVGLEHEPDDLEVDASITQVLDHSDRALTTLEIAERLAHSIAPTWCPVPRLEERLNKLEGERWVRRAEQGAETRWVYAR
jgi:hypothetical protein